MKSSKKRGRPRTLPCPQRSGRMLITMPPSSVGLFRFLLEGYGHLALFTVLNRHTALLKVIFSPHRRVEVEAALADMSQLIPWQAVNFPEPD